MLHGIKERFASVADEMERAVVELDDATVRGEDQRGLRRLTGGLVGGGVVGLGLGGAGGRRRPL